MKKKPKTATAPRKFISVAEAARRLGVEPRTVLRHLDDDTLDEGPPFGRSRTVYADSLGNYKRAPQGRPKEPAV